MQLRKFLACLGFFTGAPMAANFAAFDTTVQVKIWSEHGTDSTFIPLRNTGFTLFFAARNNGAYTCPMWYVQGDFGLRPNPSWDVQHTNNLGDSADYSQTMVTYVCDLDMYFRQVQTPGYKYQQHWWYKGTQSDTIYSKVKSIVNDSTFVLTISSTDFAKQAPTSIQAARAYLPCGISVDGYSPRGRRLNDHSRIWFDDRGGRHLN